ncbi:MAG: MarR family transcriptional regulator [Ferruginibacter sp.]
MGIEKDINQRSFRSEYQKGVINIIYTHNWLKEKLQAIFDKEDLTSQQFNILRILRGSPAALSTLQIRERMLDKMSDTSRIVDRLIKKGLAKKVTSKTDKRLVDVTITDKGRKLLQKMDQSETDIESLLQQLSVNEAKTLNKLLDKVRQA